MFFKSNSGVTPLRNRALAVLLAYPPLAYGVLEATQFFSEELPVLPAATNSIVLIALTVFYLFAVTFTWIWDGRSARATDAVPRCITRRADYYKEYYRLIEDATEAVFIVGDGFSCHDEENYQYASGLIAAMNTALKNGCVVKRFQYNTTLSLAWLQMLWDLKAAHGDKFQLFMKKELDPTALPYVICLTDPRTDKASANVMFTRSSDTTLEEKKGGAAFIATGPNDTEFVTLMKESVSAFFRSTHAIGRDGLAKLLREVRDTRRVMIYEHLSNLESIELDSTALRSVAKELGLLDTDLVFGVSAEILQERGQLYFAFGSNMDTARMNKRCPSARPLALGKVRGRELRFNIMGTIGEGKNGGIANIVSADSSKSVYGIVFCVDKVELAALNDLETSMGYRVENFDVEIDGKFEVKAVAYTTEGEPDNFAPTAAYKQFIENALERNKFPEHYKKEVHRVMDG
ncbi:MAG: gamma-glutamylcyclotransferase family protein [Pseudomonadota bacterium]